MEAGSLDFAGRVEKIHDLDCRAIVNMPAQMGSVFDGRIALVADVLRGPCRAQSGGRYPAVLGYGHELLLFLATCLRRERQSMPPPRRFTREQMGAWIAEDEADLERLRRRNP